SSRKERRRSHNINSAFSALRGCIPNVPTDTKLSKIKTLRLATSYISYLMDVLSKGDNENCESFNAEIVRNSESKEEKKRRENEDITMLIDDVCETEERKCLRTGWPQQVWASEFK
ncbi:hypothetical protein HELRODRAFT_136534, partial [Helobdella robusta]|uniref:BHLH domain-containing protein n=1 Tax=Helobdella robusta TaxID=6412 RepID=T1EIE4_HELRO